MPGCAFPPWTGVVEAQDGDGIVPNSEEQLNPNRSSIPRKTGRGVAQVLMYPCTHESLHPCRFAVAHAETTLRQWQGSRVSMRESRVLQRVKWFIGPSRQFVRLLPLHTCQPAATPDFPSRYLDDSFTSFALRLHHGSRVCTYPSRLSPGGRGGHTAPGSEAARDLHPGVQARQRLCLQVCANVRNMVSTKIAN